MCFYIEQNSVLGYGNLEQGFVHMNAQRDLQKSRRTEDDSSFRGVVPCVSGRLASHLLTPTHSMPIVTFRY